MSTSHPNIQATVGFISLGCAKNLVDSQQMAGVLVSEGISLARAPEQADVLIVNTCAFIDAARDESLESIAEACRHKTEGVCRAVIVAGCMPQRYREELAASLPGVDAFIGLDELEDVGAVVRQLALGKRHIMKVSRKARRLFEPRVPGLVFTGGMYSYLKIADGCDHRCTFCAIPGIRGAHRSRSAGNIVQEARQLLDRGVRELVLISQDVTAYGRDLPDGADLAELLKELTSLDGEYWIRWLYGFPAGITDRLVGVMGDTPTVCAYFDVPIQHSHPKILAAMGRTGTAGPVREMAKRIRASLPGAALRTTCLVGFPGETEDHFKHLLDHVEEAAFDHLGAFVYSAEEGTAAATMGERPTREVAEDRRERLLAVQEKVMEEKASALSGQETTVLLEQSDTADGTVVWTARSERQAPEVDGVVLVEDVSEAARAGDFIDVRYSGQLGFDLTATAVASC